jgi:hypothetical protein
MSISAGARRDRETVEMLDSVYLNEALEALLETGEPAYLYAGAEEAEAPEQRRVRACRATYFLAPLAKDRGRACARTNLQLRHPAARQRRSGSG